jgi:hypothetical protein
MLDLLLMTDKPVILVGAMRTVSDASWDGPANLLNAARVAASPAARGGGVAHAAGLAERQRGAGVRIYEGLFDGGLVGIVLLDHGAEALEQVVQARGELLVRWRLDDAVRDVGEARAFARDQSPAATIEARIDAENEDGAHAIVLARASGAGRSARATGRAARLAAYGKAGMSGIGRKPCAQSLAKALTPPQHGRNDTE